MNTGTLNLIRGKLPSYTRKSRHLQMLLRYADASKLSNLMRSELARVKGDIVLSSRPYIYTVDTGNVCNLRCPLCPTGYHGLERRQSLMRLGDFQTIIDKIRPFAVEVIMHNWGEPFLNPDILQMVRYARKNRIGTTISSNLNLVNRGEKFLEEVVESRLDNLTVSIDGTTQDVYETYRKGGHLENVLENLRTCSDTRKVRSPFPKVECSPGDETQPASDLGCPPMAQEIGGYCGSPEPADALNELKNSRWRRNGIECPATADTSRQKVGSGIFVRRVCFYLYAPGL